MASPATFLLSFKIILISSGAFSIAMALRFSVPFIMGFCLYDVPVLWSSLQTWLKPPYLYFIANCIIIVIAAASRFSHPYHPVTNISSTVHSRSQVPLITIRTPPPERMVAAYALAEHAAEEEERREVEEDEGEGQIVELKAVVVNGIQQLDLEGEDNDDDEDVAAVDKWIVTKSDFTPTEMTDSSQSQSQPDFGSPVKEKHLALSRLDLLSKSDRSPPEGGRAVRVGARRQRKHHHHHHHEEEEEEHDTIENTWKMITEGRHVPVSSQLEKPDTWENHGREVAVNSLDDHLDLGSPSPRSATFRDRTNYHNGTAEAVAPAKAIRKEPSLTPDELNRRAEAFIKKFNEDMRLQRQESMEQFMEMINRGAS